MAEKLVDVNPDNLKDPIELIKKERNTKSMLLFPTDENELDDIISKMDNKKSCGYDMLSNKILKSTKFTILPYIASLFNICMTEGTFPDAYKIAQVIPLFKGGDRENPNSYRPISLLPTLGKLFE